MEDAIEHMNEHAPSHWTDADRERHRIFLEGVYGYQRRDNGGSHPAGTTNVGRMAAQSMRSPDLRQFAAESINSVRTSRAAQGHASTVVGDLRHELGNRLTYDMNHQGHESPRASSGDAATYLLLTEQIFSSAFSNSSFASRMDPIQSFALQVAMKGAGQIVSNFITGAQSMGTFFAASAAGGPPGILLAFGAAWAQGMMSCFMGDDEPDAVGEARHEQVMGMLQQIMQCLVTGFQNVYRMLGQLATMQRETHLEVIRVRNITAVGLQDVGYQLALMSSFQSEAAAATFVRMDGMERMISNVELLVGRSTTEIQMRTMLRQIQTFRNYPFCSGRGAQQPTVELRDLAGTIEQALLSFPNSAWVNGHALYNNASYTLLDDERIQAAPYHDNWLGFITNQPDRIVPDVMLELLQTYVAVIRSMMRRGVEYRPPPSLSTAWFQRQSQVVVTENLMAQSRARLNEALARIGSRVDQAVAQLRRPRGAIPTHMDSRFTDVVPVYERPAADLPHACIWISHPSGSHLINGDYSDKVVTNGNYQFTDRMSGTMHEELLDEQRYVLACSSTGGDNDYITLFSTQSSRGPNQAYISPVLPLPITLSRTTGLGHAIVTHASVAVFRAAEEAGAGRLSYEYEIEFVTTDSSEVRGYDCVKQGARYLTLKIRFPFQHQGMRFMFRFRVRVYWTPYLAHTATHVLTLTSSVTQSLPLCLSIPDSDTRVIRGDRSEKDRRRAKYAAAYGYLFVAYNRDVDGYEAMGMYPIPDLPENEYHQNALVYSGHMAREMLAPMPLQPYYVWAYTKGAVMNSGLDAAVTLTPQHGTVRAQVILEMQQLRAQVNTVLVENTRQDVGKVLRELRWQWLVARCTSRASGANDALPWISAFNWSEMICLEWDMDAAMPFRARSTLISAKQQAIQTRLAGRGSEYRHEYERIVQLGSAVQGLRVIPVPVVVVPQEQATPPPPPPQSTISSEEAQELRNEIRELKELLRQAVRVQ